MLAANDSVPKYFYRNKHDGTCEDASYLSGFALNEEGREQASMGIAVGDYNRDGKVDFCITNFSDDYNALYRNDGEATFTDVSYAAGIANVTIPFLGWGTGFLDYDNDGLLDLFFANGHVYPGVDRQDLGTTWAQRPLLFRNVDGSKFEQVPPATRSGLAAMLSARGAAFGDLFNDGHIDVVLNVIDSTPVLLRNVVHNGNHWVTLKLIGGPKSPRDAAGTRVFLREGDVRQRAEVFSGASYASTSDPRVHFGLGTAGKVDTAEIFWSDGFKEELQIPVVDSILTVLEHRGITGR
ncbi:MAG: CRTAC1 family protein [Acidobacteria bacterium]|nr:CRTAC1 family protein [Acidobacteriota bacterium]